MVKFEEFKKKVEIKAKVRPKRYVLSKVTSYPKLSSKIFAVINNPNDLTIVTEENHEMETVKEEKFFKIISFENVIPIDLVGFTAYMSKIFAVQNISILVFSSYATDHILVKEKDLNKALQILKFSGVKVV